MTDLQVEVELRPGDMVCFDNWRVLHGRRAFQGERLIAGGYINREDLESALRTTNRFAARHPAITAGLNVEHGPNAGDRRSTFGWVSHQAR